LDKGFKGCGVRYLVLPVGVLHRAAVLALVVSAVVAGGTAVSAHPSQRLAAGETANCPAVDRWDVKTLTDPVASQVHFTQIERTTIDALRKLADIGAHEYTPRTPPDELRVFELRARMVEATIEGDGDIHLVIRDKYPTHKMLVEFPDPTCAFSAKSLKVVQMTAARAAFENACGTPPHGSFMPLTGSATITGVAFFDGTPVGDAHARRTVAPPVPEPLKRSCQRWRGYDRLRASALDRCAYAAAPDRGNRGSQRTLTGLSCLG